MSLENALLNQTVPVAQLIKVIKKNLKQIHIMKKLLLSLFVVAGSFAIVNAQEVSQDSTSASPAAVTPDQAADGEKVQIKAEELPEAVKQTLQDQEYKGWIINAAYQDRKDDKYEVEMKNGADTQVVKFSKEGERLDD